MNEKPGWYARFPISAWLLVVSVGKAIHLPGFMSIVYYRVKLPAWSRPIILLQEVGLQIDYPKLGPCAFATTAFA